MDRRVLKWICTDPDAYQWQTKFKPGDDDETFYMMCQVIHFTDGPYAIFRGTFLVSDYVGDTIDADSIDKYSSAFGYENGELLESKDLLAECIFEDNVLDFEENPYGVNPTYEHVEDACRKLDEWMGQSHEDMWLTDEED